MRPRQDRHTTKESAGSQRDSQAIIHRTRLTASRFGNFAKLNTDWPRLPSEAKDQETATEEDL